MATKDMGESFVLLFEQGVPYFHFELGPTNYVAVSD